MTPEQSRHEEACRWLDQARKDLNAAGLLVSAEPSRSVFHSQQAAEKAEKAFLTLQDISFRKTHDLNELGGQCAELEAGLAPLLQTAANLNEYAVVFRYLDAPREPNEEEARNALDVAERVFTVLSRLVNPPEESSGGWATLAR